MNSFKTTVGAARLCGLALYFFMGSVVLADPHDDLVYHRYSRSLKPSPIHYEFDMKFAELTRPATQQDVAKGTAVFTFEGLGPSRVWKLPKCPNFCEWLSLKDYPVGTWEYNGVLKTNFHNCGNVCQAEELQVNGQWKRYFGFLCEHGAAVVPASDIYLSLGCDCDSSPRIAWLEIPGGTDLGILGPDAEMRNGMIAPRNTEVGTPLPVELYLRNRRGIAQNVLGDLYRDEKNGGPAFRRGIRLFLDWAPFNPKTPDSNYPRSEDFKPVSLVRTNFFDTTTAGPMLGTGESAKFGVFDIRDWFKVDRPGYYQYHFTFNPTELGLSTEEASGGGTYIGFKLGKEPKRPSVEELNKDIAPFGGPQNEARLRALIHEALGKEMTNSAAEVASSNGLLVWSKPVNGLTARIEHLGFVRLKNIGHEPLLIPTGNPTNSTQQLAMFLDQDDTNTPPLILSPGESALAYTCAQSVENNDRASEVKVILRQKESITRSAWHGVLETPPYPKQPSTQLLKRYAHTQTVPDRLPKLSHFFFMGDNMSGRESEVVQLSIPNSEFLDTLELYDRNQLRVKLEAMMQAEKVLPMKLLLASEAMPVGSERAALFVLECLKNTDYHAAQDAQDAVRLALRHYEDNPPDWLVEMAIAVLSDERYVTGLQKKGLSGDTSIVMSSDTFFTMSYMADEDSKLTYTLGYLKCTNAVPFLIEMAKKTGGHRGAIMALGFIGDQRAIPVLIDFVKKTETAVNKAKGDVLSDYSVNALANLKAKEAVPVLTQYVEYPDVIEALEHIGDSRAIPPLKDLIAAKGKVDKVGVDNDPKKEQERLAAARIAVASLDPSDRTTRLCELLTDSSLGEFQRRSVVWRLGDQPDPQAISYIAKAIKTDPSGSVVNQAITVLAVFKYKSAVDALIDCFDADFKGKRDWKRAYKPEMFRENIADSLRSLTGHSLGPNKEQWLKWWQENRNSVPELK